MITLLVVGAICYPIYAVAEVGIIRTDIRNTVQRVKKPHLFKCPVGWTKVKDIIADKSKWSE